MQETGGQNTAETPEASADIITSVPTAEAGAAVDVPKFEDQAEYAARADADKAATQAATEARQAINDAKPVTIISPEAGTPQQTTTVGELPAAERANMQQFLDKPAAAPVAAPTETQPAAEPAPTGWKARLNKMLGRG